MRRFVLLLLLIIFVARAFWRVVDGVIEGLTGEPRATRVPEKRVQMVRDPVCGTYLVPERALVLTEGSKRVYFCSAQCRDQYRARTA